MNEQKNKDLSALSSQLEGDLYTDELHRRLYATDASVYREMPVGVAFPKHEGDVQKIVQFANHHHLNLIPRAAGTSLAGQVVGNGLVVDCTKYMNKILEINTKEKWVIVQPGVVLDELNQVVLEKGLFFGPETSTSTHCTIGGMFGNNSCGTHSIIYQSTREHVLEANVVLSNGDLAVFKPISINFFQAKSQEEGFEGKIYKQLHGLLKHPNVQEKIESRFPPKSVIRRNTGYALDFLLDTEVYHKSNRIFNMCNLLAGSEGTLAFSTAIKVNLVDAPPRYKAVVCLHHKSIAASCQANLIALECQPTAVELMDDIIIKMARQNAIQREQSQFIQGMPKALLMVEFMQNSQEELNGQITQFTQRIAQSGLSYHEVVFYDADVTKVWNLRKAGLGVLGNMVGDKKPVALIEDTAVAPEVLPEYVAEFEELMKRHDKECVFYAHISAGELHLRPVLNLKEEQDRKLFRTIGEESARLVAKYNGSISGEHGDGRLRGEFIPIQYGPEVYDLFKRVKEIFDPKHLFNPNKIVDTPPMDEFLRYENNQITKEFETVYDFSAEEGILRAVEKCNGVGYCRKSEKIGGTMCPSYQATRDEKDTTRARANTLREFLTNSSKENPFSEKEVKEVLDLCLSCKACKSECPSSIDMAKLKAEAMHQYYQSHGVPFRTKMIADSPKMINRFRFATPIMNAVLSTNLAKNVMGVSPKRKMPSIAKQSLKSWFQNRKKTNQSNRSIYLFNDEFLDAYDVEIGKKAVEVLEKMGYQVELAVDFISGRTHLSKGLLKDAKQLANENVRKMSKLLAEGATLIGLEPSTILLFRDEYLDLIDADLVEESRFVAQHTFTFEEFVAEEFEKGEIDLKLFQQTEKRISVHGHCQQKALIGNKALIQSMKMLPNANVTEIKSGCCGMAGSFGYEKEHYDISMKIGELVLFPYVRESSEKEIIVAPGTSCRHQIKDGTNTIALHPVEVFWEYLK